MFVCSDGCDLPDKPFNISSYYFIYYYLLIFSVGMFDLTVSYNPTLCVRSCSLVIFLLIDF